MPRIVLLAAALIGSTACGSGEPVPDAAPPKPERPSILLVTLDTVRADHLGFESGSAATPALDALAARALRFEHAYTAAPTTLPAHTSLFTGLYPAEHGVHENARTVPAEAELLAAKLAAAGYDSAAVVSGFPLSRRFGIARGFATYIDDFPGSAAERRADATTDRALAILAEPRPRPLFLWVHYFDAHEPYAPPEPWASRYPGDPYLGEIAFLDHELGRLLAVFEEAGGAHRIVVGDHGEGLGDHGEALHGNLLYQETMRVPLLVAAPDLPPAVRSEPVSTRRVHDTVLAWAGGGSGTTLAELQTETVLGEAMKTHLQYGWQPQVMAVRGSIKAIRSGTLEVYDLAADPGEHHDLAGETRLERALAEPLRDYPTPGRQPASAPALDQADRERLASLGYVDWDGRAAPRPDAPSAREMVQLFADLDRASGLFVRGRYGEAAPVLEDLLEDDSGNLMVALRLAVAYSSLGRQRKAEAAFAAAREIDPSSLDVAHYHALHLARGGRPRDAAPLFELVLTRTPERLEALEGLARVRAELGDPAAAENLLERSTELAPRPESLAELGDLRMAMTDTAGAIQAFERARDLAPEAFDRHLELGVCYLVGGRTAEAAATLDRVAPRHPAYPMALFKRAQAAALLGEPDLAERVHAAHRAADPGLRRMIEDERLFQGVEGAPPEP